MELLHKDRYVFESGLSSDKLDRLLLKHGSKGIEYHVYGQTTWIDVPALERLIRLLASETTPDDARSTSPTPLRENESKSSRGTHTPRLV